MKKTFFVLALSVLVILPVFAFGLTAHAQTAADNMLWGGFEGNVQTATGLGNTDPREMAGQVVNILLGFLGIIAVVIILLGGFKWMTAGGNEEGIGEAKKIITAGIIGLVIIFISYALAWFVIQQLISATGAA